MQQLTLPQAADYLQTASIEQTNDVGHAIIHIGMNRVGAKFVLVNDAYGQTALFENV